MNPISQISKQIHRTDSRIWHLNKAIEGVPRYALMYKNMDKAEEILKSKRKARELREQRTLIKNMTPKTLWYPKKKYRGRYNNQVEKIKSKIMQECFDNGFNVKQIAGYFNLTLAPVYKRIKVKLKREL